MTSLLLLLLFPTIATSFQNQVKRSSECIANSTYTVSASAVFSITSCDSEWGWWYALYISYTPDFESCMAACVEWNSHSQDICTGVTWFPGSYGPYGISGGSGCTFFWDTTSPSQLNDTYSAQLLTPPRRPNIPPAFSPDIVNLLQTTISAGSPVATSQPETDEECRSHNATGYDIGQDKFDLFCDVTWAPGYDLYLNFTTDFFSCIDACVNWNSNASAVPCAGVGFSTENYGPRGLAEGTQCWYRWSMPDGDEGPFVGA